MTSSSSGKQKPKPFGTKNSGSTQKFDQRYLGLDQRCFLSPVTGQPVSVENASDEEFDIFIRQYIEVEWTLEERLNALVDALNDGQEIEFCHPKIAG